MENYNSTDTTDTTTTDTIIDAPTATQAAATKAEKKKASKKAVKKAKKGKGKKAASKPAKPESKAEARTKAQVQAWVDGLGEAFGDKPGVHHLAGVDPNLVTVAPELVTGYDGKTLKALRDAVSSDSWPEVELALVRDGDSWFVVQMDGKHRTRVAAEKGWQVAARLTVGLTRAEAVAQGVTYTISRRRRRPWDFIQAVRLADAGEAKRLSGSKLADRWGLKEASMVRKARTILDAFPPELEKFVRDKGEAEYNFNCLDYLARRVPEGGLTAAEVPAWAEKMRAEYRSQVKAEKTEAQADKDIASGKATYSLDTRMRHLEQRLTEAVGDKARVAMTILKKLKEQLLRNSFTEDEAAKTLSIVIV